MDKIKNLEIVAKILRNHDGYKKKKDSNRSSRFDFSFDKEMRCIEIYNAERGNDLFLWDEFAGLADAIDGLSHYFICKKGQVVLEIY